MNEPVTTPTVAWRSPLTTLRCERGGPNRSTLSGTPSQFLQPSAKPGRCRSVLMDTDGSSERTSATGAHP
ncbi:hypothetical protein M8J75_010167 [Diaphorina citri]|nr:hypothetical protein M8J75_010167 [Diaphorina citri]